MSALAYDLDDEEAQEPEEEPLGSSFFGDSDDAACKFVFKLYAGRSTDMSHGLRAKPTPLTDDEEADLFAQYGFGEPREDADDEDLEDFTDPGEVPLSAAELALADALTALDDDALTEDAVRGPAPAPAPMQLRPLAKARPRGGLVGLIRDAFGDAQ